MKRLPLLLLTASAVLLIFSCTPKDGTASKAEPAPAAKPVTIATMIDSEGAILGTMMVKLLEAKGIPVVDRTEFGTPEVLRKALESGEVDLVLDYTGSGQYYHEGNDPAI